MRKGLCSISGWFIGLAICGLMGAPQVLGQGVEKIVFQSDRDGNSEIYVMDADGSNQINLTNTPEGEYYPAWSPDGTKIAFVSQGDGNQEIYVMDADGSNRINLTNHSDHDRLPSWSPDGTKIAFDSNRINPAADNYEIFVMDADGSNQTRLTDIWYMDGYPAFSPDGTKIAWGRDIGGTYTGEIFVMDADGSNQNRLTYVIGRDSNPAWSPDGTRIAFSSQVAINAPYDVYVMDVNGSNKINLTNHPSTNDIPTRSAWAAEANKIVFWSNRDGNYEIYVMDADGSNQINLSNNSAYDAYPTWSPVLAASAGVSLPTLTATYNEVISMPVSLADVQDALVSAEVFLSYDSALLTYDEVITAGNLTAGWSIQSNLEDGAGTTKILKIAAATDNLAITTDGTLLEVQFTVEDVRVPASSPLTLEHVLLNDGDPENVTTDGLVTLVGNTATIETDVAEIIPRESITVTVTDADADVTGGTDQVSVEVVNVTTGDAVSLTIDETDVTSGQFIETVDTEFGTGPAVDGIIQAQADDVIEFRFVDALDVDGNGPATRIASVTAKGGNDGSVQVSVVTQPGDQLYIEVVDADLTIAGLADVAVLVETDGGDSESVTLNEVVGEADVFFGQIITTPSGGVAGELTTTKGVIVTVTYDDVVTALGDQLDRVATSDVVDPFGDVDSNGSIQAYDASLVLQSLLINPPVVLTGLDLLSADVADDFGQILPLDAAHILQRIVGLRPVFDVQLPGSLNHPQGVATPKWMVEERQLALRVGEGYVSLWAEDLSGIVSGEVVLEGVSGRVELGEELADFLSVSGAMDDGVQVLFAGAESISGPGELLRVYVSGVGPDRARLTRAVFNDGSLVGRVGEVRAVPSGFVLYPNVPNPFNPETVIRYGLPVESAVVVEVFDVVGQRVKVLVSGVRSSGDHEVVWDGRDEAGGSVSSGVYFYRLRMGEGFSQMRRMLLLK
jgi:Tol biopolymer transport system component